MTMPSGLVALDEDHHVHSTFSDDAVSTVADNVRAARDRGLRVVCLADHVRQGSPWVPDFVAAVREVRPVPGLEVLAGVEAKILNRAGELDLPASLRGVDRVLIADHQYPGDHGPIPPQDMRDALERRQCSAADVLDGLIAATLGALQRTALPQLAHLFSLLPKMGLDEADVPGRPWTTWPRAATGPGRGWRSTRSGPARPRGRSGPWPRPGCPWWPAPTATTAPLSAVTSGCGPSWTARCAERYRDDGLPAGL